MNQNKQENERFAEALSDGAWADIHAGVVAEVALRRIGPPPRFRLIPLAELVRHRTLPMHQSIDGLVEWSTADLTRSDRIPLFISHRWHSSHVPDDGSMIAAIFAFCLSVVIKNNFHHLRPPVEVHHSRSLSDRLTKILAGMQAPEILRDTTSFGGFDRAVSAAVPDDMEAHLIRVALSRFHIWIDYCCLPQETHVKGTVVARTPAEDLQFQSGLDGMDTLLHHAECALLWSPSELTRAWLFYESMMSIPLGRASFMASMELSGALSTVVRQYHSGFSELGLLNSLMVVQTFKKVGITATSHRDIRKIIFLMSENLKFTDWKFRVIQ